MQPLVGERVLETLQQHDLKAGEHSVANAVVDHRKGQLAIPTNTRNQLIIFLWFFFFFLLFSPMLIKIKSMLSFCNFHKHHNSSNITKNSSGRKKLVLKSNKL